MHSFNFEGELPFYDDSEDIECEAEESVELNAMDERDRGRSSSGPGPGANGNSAGGPQMRGIARGLLRLYTKILMGRVRFPRCVGFVARDLIKKLLCPRRARRLGCMRVLFKPF